MTTANLPANLRKFLFASLLVPLGAAPALADEGMWTFDNFPAETVREKYGVTVDQAWLDHVRAGAVRLSTGCSASIVSGEGLVFTNHHCVAGCAQDLSTSERDYVREGFAAATREEERQCPGMQAEALLSISDVTAAVNAATAGTSGEAFTAARDGAIAGIEKDACAGNEAMWRCQVISLYEGGQYKLYTYRKYSDVRLVFAVEIQTAFFGGDPDNFNFPRYDLDCSFVRLYENGVPVATPDHLRWSADPPAAGEPVFVAGNPGGTDRLLTAPQLESLRDFVYPDLLLLYAEIRGRYARFSEESEEHARIATRDLFGVENTLKRLRGQYQALLEPALFERKRAADADLKARVAADPALSAEIGNPWQDIAAAQMEREALNTANYFLEARAGFGSDLFYYARRLVRAAAERAKPNEERLPEYADARLPLMEKNVLDPAPVEPELEELKLAFWLSKLREFLTADAPEVGIFLGRDSPETIARRLAQSQLADPAVRRALWDGGQAAIDASGDPMIRYVIATDEASRDVRKAYEERVEGPVDRAMERIAKARFAIYGTEVYPDATFSLRLSYGQIAGWSEPGREIPPFTYYSGLWDRATGQPPFDLAPRWAGAQDRVDPATVFNISSTNDVVGGNSGSPLINAEGEVIGAIFDGNIHSLGGTFDYDPELNRTVSVAAAAITEALTNIYGQDALVAELTGRFPDGR